MAGIKFDFTGDNKNLLNAAKQAQTGVTNAISAIERAGSGIESTFSKIKGSVLGGFADIAKGMAGLTAMLQAGNFLKTLVDDAAKFNLAMKEVSTLSEDVARNFQQYKGQVVDMTTQIPIGATKAANALYQIESAGHHGADGLNVLRESAKGAIGGVTDTATTADAITTILNAYKMEASEAKRVSDLLFTTVRLGKTNMSQLGTTIAQVAPVAASFGVSIEDVLAAIASLTKQGTKTSVAVRQVRDAITATTKSMGDNAFQGRSFLDAMDEVAQKAQGSNNALRQDLGTLQALNAVLSLTGKNSQAARQDVIDMQDSAGAAEAAYEKMASNAGAQTTLLRNNILKNILPMADEIRSMSGDIAKFMNEAFDSGAMDKAIVSLEAFIATYATYRGMLTATTAWNSAALGGVYQAQIAELQKLIPLKELDGQADLQAAVAKGKLTIEQAKLVASLRAETEARYEEIVAAETEARSNLKALTVAEASATANLAAAEEMVVSAQARVAAATQSGVATDIETAKEELNTAEMLKNDAMRQKSIITRQREGAQTMANVTSKNAETAATLMNTTQQGVNATSTGVLATAKLHLKKAVDAVNASFLTSPLFWIAATIAGVTYAVYKLYSALNETDESQSKLNETINKSQAEIASEQKQIDQLFDKLRKAEEGTNEYKETKDAIIRQYGKYLNGLGDEIRTLKNVEGAYKAVASAARDAALARGRDAALSEANSAYGLAYADYTGKIYDAIKKSAGEENAKNALRAIRADLKLTGKVAEDTENAIVRVTNGAVKRTWFGELNKAEQNLADANERINATFQAQGGEIRTVANETEKLDTAYSEAEKKFKRAQKWLDTIKKNRKDYTLQEFKDAVESLKAAKEALEDVGGGPDGKQAKAAAQAAKQAHKEAEDIAKESAAEREKLFELELADMERQAKQKAALESALADKAIAEERSASKRELMQMEKDHKERLAAIDRQAEEYKKEAYEAAQKKWEALNKGKAWADTDEAKAGWQAMSLTAGQEKELQALRDAINADAVRKQKEYLDQLIQSHASYASKKLAIEKKYSEDVAAINAGIAEAEANGYAQRVEELKQSLAEAEKERAKSQAQLSLEQLKETPEYIRAFEDLDNTSNETLEHLIKMFEDAKQAAAQSLNPKDLKEYTDAIEQMQGKIRERDPFKALAQSSKELSEAHKKVKKAEQDLELVRKGGFVLVNEIDKKTGELTARILSQKEAEEKLRVARDDEFKAQSRYSKAQQASLNIINELGSSISNLGNAIGGTAGKIVELIGDVISFASGAITALGETTEGVSTAVKAAEKASAILAIISAALQIVNKITDVLGADYEHYNKLVDQYKNLIDVWDTLIAKKREYINESYGAEATKVGQEVLDILNKQILAYRQLGKERLSSGASMGSNTIGVRIRKDLTLDDWRAVQRSLGSTDEFAGLGGRLEGLFDLSAKQLEKLREDAPAFWAKLDEDVRKYLQGIIDGSEEVEKQQEAMIEKLTGMTSGGMFEDFRNSLYELADGSKEVFEDIAENWQKMVNRMVVDNLIAKEFQDDLEKILKDIADIQTKRNETNTVEYMAKYEEEKNNLLKELEEVKSRFFLADVENDLYVSNPIYQQTREKYEKDIARIKAIQEEIKKLDEEYEQALVTIDDEEYKRQLNEKLEEYKKIYGEAEGKLKLYQELGIIKSIDEATAEAKTYFEDLRNSWKSSLMDMTQTSEDWKNTLIDQIFSDLVESAILEKPFDTMIDGAEKHFNNFQEYLDDWTKRYKEIIEDQTLTDEERNAKLKALLDEQTDIRDKQADEAKKIGEGIGKDMSESFSNSLDNLGDTLLDALLDTEKDAQQMGVEIAQTLIKEMLTEMLASEKYASRIEAIRKMWQAILKGEDKEHTFADVLQEISDLNDAIANDEDISQLAETYQILGKQAEEAKTSLGDLRDVFMDAVTDMDNGMDNLKKKLKETAIKDLIQKMLFTKDFDEWEKSWNERYLKALEAGDEALINNLNKELEERVDAAAKSVSNYTKQLQEAAVDTTFTDMEDSFVSALMDMDGDIQGFAEDMKKTIVQKLVESFMVSEKIKPMLDELQKTFDFAMGQKGWTNEQRIDFMSKGGTIDGKEYKGIDEYSDDINDWKNTVDGLLAYAGIVKNETDELLGSITSNITSMLTDGESTAKDFAESMKESIVNSLIEAYTASEDFQEGLADVKKQMQEAIESGDPVKIQKAEEAAKNFWGNAVDGVKEYTDALEKAQQEQDTTFKEMASSWVSNLMDFSATAEDWAEDIGRTMAQRIIEQMVEPTMIAPLLNNLQEVFNKVMAENTTEDEDGKAVYNWEGVLGNQELAQAIADMEAKYPELKELIQKIMGAFGVKPDDTIANSLDSLGSTLIDRLTDMETSAEDYGKKIGAALVKDMLDQLVATGAYADEIEAIQELWQDILSGADTEHTWENVLERVNALTEKLTNENKGLIETYGELTKKVEEEAKAEEAFSGLGDKIVSSLMDANTTAESFAKEIAKTMVEQMLGQIVESQFATKMQAIQDEWAAALAANDVNAIARIKEEIIALQQEVGVATQEMVDSVKEVIANDTTFSGMTSSWVSALSDMSKTAEDWAEDIGRTMAEAIISQIIAPTLIQPLLDEMQKAFDAVMAVEGATWQMAAAAMVPYIEQVKATYEELQPIVEEIYGSFGVYREVVDTVEEAVDKVEYALDDMRGTFDSTLMDMESTAEKRMRNISEILAEKYIDKFILGDLFDQQMEAWQQQFENIVSGGLSEEERERQLVQLRNAITAAEEGYMEESRAIQELLGLNASDDQKATMNMADKITYDQADQLLGINMAQEMTLEQGLYVQRQILSTIQQMGGITSVSGDGKNSDIFNRLGYTNDYLRAIRDSNDAILTSLNAKLDLIYGQLSNII